MKFFPLAQHRIFRCKSVLVPVASTSPTHCRLSPRILFNEIVRKFSLSWFLCRSHLLYLALMLNISAVPVLAKPNVFADLPSIVIESWLESIEELSERFC